MSNRWVSVEEIAGHLGVSKDTIYGWISKKGMPAHKVGKLWKFKINEVDAWVRCGESSDNNSEDKTTISSSEYEKHARGEKANG